MIYLRVAGYKGRKGAVLLSSRSTTEIILHASSSSQCRISRTVNFRYTQRLVNILPSIYVAEGDVNDINARSLYWHGSRFYRISIRELELDLSVYPSLISE